MLRLDQRLRAVDIPPEELLPPLAALLLALLVGAVEVLARALLDVDGLGFLLAGAAEGPVCDFLAHGGCWGEGLVVVACCVLVLLMFLGCVGCGSSLLRLSNAGEVKSLG